MTCCLQYNGCKWLGGVLRVEKAKPHYLNRLQTEWDTKPDSEHDAQDAASVQELSIQDDPMRIATPASGFVKRKVSCGLNDMLKIAHSNFRVPMQLRNPHV